MLIEGLAVAEIQLLFLQNWRRQSGGRLPHVGAFPALEVLGDQTIRTDGVRRGSEGRYISSR